MGLVTCGACAAGAAAQLAGLLPHGVPVCRVHGVPRVRVITRRGPFHFYGLSAFVLWTVTRLLRLVTVGVWWALRHPRTTITAAVCVEAVVVVRAHGALWLVLAVFLTGALLGLWATIHPASLGNRARAWWRRWTVYRREWSNAMSVAELTRKDDEGRRLLPRLVRVRCTGDRDLVRVRGVLGQRPEEWREASRMLAHVFKAASCRVTKGDDRRLTLEFVRSPQHRRSWGDRPTPSP